MKLRNAILALLLAAPALRAKDDGSKLADLCPAEPQVEQLVRDVLEKTGIHDTQALSSEDSSCPPQIPEGTQLEVAKIHWDSVLHSFEVRLRCLSPSACLPFLVRVRPHAGSHLSRAGTNALGAQKSIRGASAAMVKPGQLVTLFWEKGELADQPTRGVPRSRPGGRTSAHSHSRWRQRSPRASGESRSREGRAMKSAFQTRWARLLAVVVITAVVGWAREKAGNRKSLEEYLRRLPQEATLPAATTMGSLWTDQGRMAELASDYKAHRVGDLITVLVVQSLQAENTGNVATDRNFSASSGIDALAGHISTSGVQNIFSARSSQSLQGKAQATSTSSLRTSLTGYVVALLPSGTLVIEAQREIVMNNERQMMVLRGLVRPGDLSPDNAVVSNEIGNLELEIKGKGVVSDGTRPPNVFMRWLLRLLGF